MHINDSIFARPKTVVKYGIRAKILNHDGTFLKYKQLLVLHEPPVEFQQNALQLKDFPIATCCCCAQGNARIQVQFSKNVFFTNEQAFANVTVDNSQCNLPINQISFNIIQHLRIVAPGRDYNGEYTCLSDKRNVSINPRHPEHIMHQFVLNLVDIKYKVNPIRQTGNKQRSPEEMFMMQQMAPAVHSRHIKNDYYLQASVSYDGCICGNMPQIRIPLTVIPMTHMDSYGFLEPVGYAPVELAYFKLDHLAKIED